MDARQLLLNRVSCGKLASPAPARDQLNVMYAAASRAADHACLKPYRFIEIEGDALLKLGDLFMQAASESDPQMSEPDLEKLSKKPLRAPMIIVAVATFTEHPKVPQWEQLVTAGCATQNLINAAYLEGVGVYWRTGSMAEHPLVAEGLGLASNEKLIGFVYTGTPAISLREAPAVMSENFVSQWP